MPRAGAAWSQIFIPRETDFGFRPQTALPGHLQESLVCISKSLAPPYLRGAESAGTQQRLSREVGIVDAPGYAGESAARGLRGSGGTCRGAEAARSGGEHGESWMSSEISPKGGEPDAGSNSEGHGERLQAGEPVSPRAGPASKQQRKLLGADFTPPAPCEHPVKSVKSSHGPAPVRSASTGPHCSEESAIALSIKHKQPK